MQACKYTWVLPFLFLLSACVPYFYQPNTINMPLFNENRETQVSAQMGFNGLDLQGATTLGKHWGIMINGIYKLRKDYHYTMWDVGFGYHGRWGASTFFEIYTGMGLGWSVANKDSYNYTLTSKVYDGSSQSIRNFMQIDFGWKSEDIVLGLGLRYSTFNYTKVRMEESVYFKEDSSYTHYSYFHSPRREHFLEPGIVLMLGTSPIRIMGSAGLSFLLAEPGYDDRREVQFYKSIYFSMGLHYTF